MYLMLVFMAVVLGCTFLGTLIYRFIFQDCNRFIDSYVVGLIFSFGCILGAYPVLHQFWGEVSSLILLVILTTALVVFFQSLYPFDKIFNNKKDDSSCE